MSSVIHRDPDILGGTPVFRGTRVPTRILFEHLEAGDNLEVFLTDFPSVAYQQASEVLHLALDQLTGVDELRLPHRIKRLHHRL